MPVFNFKSDLSQSSFFKALFASAMLLTLTACPFNDDDDNNTETSVDFPPPPPPPLEYSYLVKVTNLTNAQPMSPVAAVMHKDMMYWKIGEMASVPLEKIAEGGDSADFLAQADVLANASSEGMLMPGLSTEFTINTTDRMATHFTVVTMLVNTNDAFSGLTGVDVSSLTVDATKTWLLGVYDSGTEKNSELAGTIPGPADGGTGYDSERDDVDVVAMHGGVVSKDDGLTQSVLTQAHRFDNPTLKLTITRTK